MRPLKIAMIGNKHDHAVNNFLTMKKHPEAFEIIGVSEMTKGLRDDVYEGYTEFTADELLKRDDLEAVVIEAGKENEIVYAQMFANKGIAVFIDKPGSADVPRFERFINTMREKALPVGLGYMYRFNPIVQKAMDMKNSGSLGNIFSVEAHMSVRHDTEKRKWLARYKGGALYFLGCHLIDTVCRFMGFPDEIIPLSCPTGNECIDSEDLGCAVFKYKNGVAFIKTCLSEYNGFDRRQLVITGTKGTLEIRPWEEHAENGQITKAKITLAENNPDQWKDCSENITTEPYDRYYPMLLHFAKTVRGEEKMLMSYEYELELFKTIVRACGAENDIFRPEGI